MAIRFKKKILNQIQDESINEGKQEADQLKDILVGPKGSPSLYRITPKQEHLWEFVFPEDGQDPKEK